MFCFNLSVLGLNRNILLFLWLFPDQFKLLCFVPEFWAKTEHAIKNIFSLAKSKCFACSNNKLWYRNVCAIVSISLTLLVHRNSNIACAKEFFDNTGSYDSSDGRCKELLTLCLNSTGSLWLQALLRRRVSWK